MDYAEAGAAARAVFFAANGLELTVRQHRALNAVVALTALYSRLEDRVYLGQIAAFAFGVERAEPWMAKKTRETLGELEELGLVLRVPPGRGRPPLGHEGPAYWIALGTPDIDPGPGAISSPENDPDPGPKMTPIPGRKAPRPRAENDPDPGAENDPAPGPPTEKTSEEAPEEPSEEGRRGTRPRRRVNGHDVGSLAARLTACATTDDAGRDREAERVVELLLHHLGADAAGTAVDDILSSGAIHRPSDVLTAVELVIDDDHASAVEELYADRRFRALVRGGPVLAIVDACPGDWGAHLEEAELVVEHLERHGYPGGLLRQLVDAVERDGLRRPGHAARIARDLAAEVGIDLPRLDLPPARRIARSRT